LAYEWAGSLPRSEVVDFLDKTRATLDDYADLDPHLHAHDRGFKHAAERVGGLAARYREPFRLVVAGDFNTGKSTLINALLGRKRLLAERAVATTGTSTELWWGQDESGEVLTADGSLIFSGDIRTAIKYADQNTAEGNSVRAQQARIVLRVNAPLLRNLVIIDTPGLGSSERDNEVTRAALDLADAAVLAVSALQPGTDDARQLAEWLRTHGRRVLLAVTWLDAAKPEDRADAMAAATRLLAAVIEGDPVAVNAPAIPDCLAALEAAELRADEAASIAAREQLAAYGYTELLDRLQRDFAHGDAGLNRLHAAMSSAAAVLRPLAAAARQSAAAADEQIKTAGSEVSELAKRVNSVLPDRADYLDEKIAEAVDTRVAEYIVRFSEAADVFVDKLAAGRLQATVRAMRTFTKSGKAKASEQIKREFDDLFPNRQLEIVVNDLTRAAGALLRAEWGAATAELAPMAPGHNFNLESLTRRVAEQIAAANAKVMAEATLWVVLLFTPGGVVFDAVALVLAAMRRKTPGKRTAQAISLQKREMRVRIGVLRTDLVDRLGAHYRNVNHSTRDSLIADATAEQAELNRGYDELQARLRRLTQAIADVSRLEASANGLAGQDGA
jgi:GTP-binding protein EngB required for normal cell division